MRIPGFHQHQLSRVWTVNGRSYQVCLDCAREFVYDLKAMKQVEPKRAKLQIVSRRA